MPRVNRYTAPAQDRYQSTYVPLPYEQIMATVASRQAQLDKEQDMLNKTYEDTQNIKYIPGTKDEQYVRDYIGKTSDLVGKYFGADLSDPIVKQQMRSEFNKITNRQNIQNIQTSHAAWSDNQKIKAQMKAQGLYDPMLDEDPANANWDTVGSGSTYNYVTPVYKNPRPVGEQYFNNIKASDLGTDKEGNYFFQGVDRNKINEVVDTKWNEFVNTSEGNLYVKKIARERGLDYTDPNIRKQIGTEYLKGIGEEFIYRDRAGATLEGQVRAARGKKDPEGPRKYTTQDQTLIATKEHDPLKVGEIVFNDKGDIAARYNDVPSGAPPGSPFYRAQGTTPEEDRVRIQQHKEKLAEIRNKIPEFKGLSDEDTYKGYKQLAESSRAMRRLPVINVSPQAHRGLADQIYNSFGNRSAYIQDDFGESDLTNMQDVKQEAALKDLGLTPTQLRNEIGKYAAGKESIVSVVGIAPGAKKPGMVQLQVLDTKRDGKNKFRTLYVDNPANEASYIFTPSAQIQQARENFDTTEIPVGYSQQLNSMVYAKISPKVTKDKDGKWIYNSELEQGYKDPNGNFVSMGEANIMDIMDAEMNIYLNSGYLNSDIETVNDTNPFGNNI